MDIKIGEPVETQHHELYHELEIQWRTDGIPVVKLNRGGFCRPVDRGWHGHDGYTLVCFKYATKPYYRGGPVSSIGPCNSLKELATERATHAIYERRSE